MKTLSKKFWLCLWVVLFLAVPGTGSTEVLKVAFAHWPPWKIIEGDHFEGIDAGIVQVIGERLGVSMRFVKCPWPRCIEMAKSGDIDLITSFGRTPSRERFVYYLGPPYIVEQVAFYVCADDGVTIEKHDDLLGKKIGTIKGSTYFAQFDDDKMLDKTPLNTQRQLFEMLASGRIDLFIGFQTVIDYLLLIEGFEGRFKKSPLRVASNGSHIAMPMRSGAQQWRKQISKLVAQMVAQGEIDRIIQVFFQKVGRRQNHNPPFSDGQE